MTILAVDQGHAESLSRQGYATTGWVGFGVHDIPLYAHHPVSDKKVGDVVSTMRVGDPRTLNNAEAVHLSRQAAYGYFMFKPDADCLKRDFKNIEFRKRPGGGVEKIEGPSQKGCAWCRARQTNPTPSESAVLATPPREIDTPQAPALPSYDVLHCRSCPEVFVGESASTDRRMHEMRHKSKASTARRKSRSVPAEGSAKES